MMRQMSNPREFFEQMVKPSYRDWRAEPLAEHRAKATVGFANDMAERMFHYLVLDKKYGPRGTARYRDELAINCSDFGLLRDIADNTKHFRIGRSNRKVSSAEQTSIGALTWERLGDKWEEAAWTWEESGSLLIVTLDTGTQRSLISVVNNVMSMWEKLLQQYEL